MLCLFVTSLLVLSGPAPADHYPNPIAPPPVSTWKIDATHSELLFRIRHLVSTVTGTFTDWDGTIIGDPEDWKGGSVTVNIRTASISTNNDRRDTHLRSADFFDAENYPQLTFKSTSVTVSGQSIILKGELTMRGVTKPIVLSGTFTAVSPSGDGKDRVGFEVSTTINRLDYGVSWNRAAEGGGALLGDEVTIQVTVEAVRQIG